jgi:thiol-disulfide isomerase/thioredoxin
MMRWLTCSWAAALCLQSVAAADPATTAGAATAEIPAPVYVTLMLARDPAVHAELGLKPQQIEAVQAAVAEVDQPLWLLRDVPVDQCGEKLETLRQKLRGGLAQVYSPDQAARFEQLIVQARGSKALVAADVAEKLKLSQAQREQFRQIVAEARSGSLDAKRVMGVLEPQQQQTLAALFGPRFDVGRVSQIGCIAPELRGIDTWINSRPLTLAELRGKVVVVHFWAFGCINCIHNLPHYQAWYDKFPQSDLVIIGLHTPETSAERDVENLRQNVKQRGIEYPVAFDAAADNWKAWANNLWPSVYLIDRRGQVRGWWYGELNWEGAKGEESMRKRIEKLLAEK